MQLVIIKVYKKRFYIIIKCMLIHIGGSLYSIGKFSNSDILLVTDISCSQSDTSISQCTISHYTKTSYCDVKDIAAVKCHSKSFTPQLVGEACQLGCPMCNNIYANYTVSTITRLLDWIAS